MKSSTYFSLVVVYPCLLLFGVLQAAEPRSLVEAVESDSKEVVAEFLARQGNCIDESPSAFIAISRANDDICKMLLDRGCYTREVRETCPILHKVIRDNKSKLFDLLVLHSCHPLALNHYEFIDTTKHLLAFLWGMKRWETGLPRDLQYSVILCDESLLDAALNRMCWAVSQRLSFLVPERFKLPVIERLKERAYTVFSERITMLNGLPNGRKDRFLARLESLLDSNRYEDAQLERMAQEKKEARLLLRIKRDDFLTCEEAGDMIEAGANPSLYDAMRKSCLIYAVQRARK